MYQLIENSKWSQLEKDKTYAVLKGIVTYLDRGDELLEHHRRYPVAVTVAVGTTVATLATTTAAAADAAAGCYCRL